MPAFITFKGPCLSVCIFSLLIPTPALFPWSQLGSLCGSFFSAFLLSFSIVLFFYPLWLRGILFFRYIWTRFKIQSIEESRKTESQNQSWEGTSCWCSGLDSVLPSQGAQVWSLVGELRSCKPRDVVKTRKITHKDTSWGFLTTVSYFPPVSHLSEIMNIKFRWPLF